MDNYTALKVAEALAIDPLAVFAPLSFSYARYSAASIPLPGAISSASVFVNACVDIDIGPPSVITDPIV